MAIRVREDVGKFPPVEARVLGSLLERVDAAEQLEGMRQRVPLEEFSHPHLRRLYALMLEFGVSREALWPSLERERHLIQPFARLCDDAPPEQFPFFLAELRLKSVARSLPAGPQVKFVQKGIDRMLTQCRQRVVGHLPRICVSTEEEQKMHDVVDAALEAIARHPEALVYQRGDQWVRIIHDDTNGTGQGDRAKIDDTPLAARQELLDRVATWLDKQGRITKPPMWIVKTASARGTWPFPTLRGLTTTPCLRTDGTVLEVAGYDTASGLYLAPELTTFPKTPEQPTRAEALQALELLRELLADFPFRTPADHSAALAMLLTGPARHAIKGDTPVFVVQSPTRGSGKTLLVDVAAILLTGCRAPRTAQSTDEEERKRLVSFGLTDRPIIFYDNVTQPFGTAAIAAALTGGLSDRLLGENRTVTVGFNALWCATGNNMSTRCDLDRRIVPITLDPELERPEERRGFRHDPLLEWVQAQRGRLVTAILTIWRAWIVAGRPVTPHLVRFGGFERWSQVREVLAWLEQPDPPLGLREAGDADAEALSILLTAWFARYGSEPQTVADACQDAETDDTLRAALGGVQRGFDGRLKPQSLGHALRRFANRIIGGLRFERLDKSERGLRWRVVQIGAADNLTSCKAARLIGE